MKHFGIFLTWDILFSKDECSQIEIPKTHSKSNNDYFLYDTMKRALHLAVWFITSVLVSVPRAFIES